VGAFPLPVLQVSSLLPTSLRRFKGGQNIFLQKNVSLFSLSFSRKTPPFLFLVGVGPPASMEYLQMAGNAFDLPDLEGTLPYQIIPLLPRPSSGPKGENCGWLITFKITESRSIARSARRLFPFLVLWQLFSFLFFLALSKSTSKRSCEPGKTSFEQPGRSSLPFHDPSLFPPLLFQTKTRY